MLNNIKRYIIKKLGGYTTQEVTTNEQISSRRIEGLEQELVNVSKILDLCVQRIYKGEDFDNLIRICGVENFTKEHIVNGYREYLLEHFDELIDIDVRADPQYGVIITSKIKIAERKTKKNQWKQLNDATTWFDILLKREVKVK